MFLSSFNWYGFLIAMGMVVGMFGAFLVARWRGFSSDVAFDICLWAIPLAIVGARLNFVISDAIQGGDYSGWSGFLKVIGFENGKFIGLYGLSIYGGLIGAIAGIFFNSLVYKHKGRKETFLNMVDLGAPFMLLGQAIGRWGNLVNGELYGGIITNPAWQWFPVAIEKGGMFYHALSFYESVFNLIGCALLFWMLLGNRRSRQGTVIAGYFIWYGLVRACLELFRQPEFIMYWGNIPISFVDSILLVLVGAGLLIYFIVKARKEGTRIPLFVKREQWHETGRDIFEWGRDYHQKLPPLFKRSAVADVETEDVDEALIEETEQTELSDQPESLPSVCCPRCGATVDAEVENCPFCGQKISQDPNEQS